MKQVLVTGGLGFLGQYLTKGLIEENPDIRITILARTKRDLLFPEVFQNPRIRIYYHCDLLQPNSYGNHFTGVDTVFHCAAMVSFWKKDRKTILEHNTETSANVVNLCKHHKVKKLVYVSSTAALGYNDDPDNPADESFRFSWKKAKKYSYGYSKFLAEKEVLSLAGNDLPVIVVNPSSIYGPGDDKIHLLFDSIQNRSIPFMLPGGLACIDVRDAASGILAAARKGGSGERYILAGGNYTHIHLMSTIARALNTPPPPRVLSPIFGAVIMPIISLMETLSAQPPKITSEIFDMGLKFRYFTTEKAKNQLHWVAKYSLENTMQDIVHTRREMYH